MGGYMHPIFQYTPSWADPDALLFNTQLWADQDAPPFNNQAL